MSSLFPGCCTFYQPRTPAYPMRGWQLTNAVQRSGKGLDDTGGIMASPPARVPNIELECMPVGGKLWQDIDISLVKEELKAITRNFHSTSLLKNDYAPQAIYWEQLEIGRWVLTSTMTIRKKQ